MQAQPLHRAPAPGVRRPPALLFALVLTALALAAALAGCSGGYQGRVFEMNQALREGDTERALLLADQAIADAEGVKASEGDDLETESIDDVQADLPLLLLERATLYQAAGKHKEAVRDFAEADKSLEVLDLTAGDSESIGQYIFSDDAKTYKAPPHEKLLLNTLAMVSWLALDDLEGARVEARRLAVLQKYFKDAAPEELTLFGLGSFLAGFTFEMSGQQDEALRFYLEAWRTHGFQAAREPVARLSRAVAYSDGDIEALHQELGELPDPDPDQGTLLIVVQNGRAPFKVAERIPVGAIATADLDNHRWHMTAEQRADADRAVASGLLKWINFPVLHVPDDAFTRVNLTLDGKNPGEPSVKLNVEAATRAAWEQDSPKLLFAAFTRMVTRALAAETTSAVATSLGGGKGNAQALGWILGRVVEGALTAADTPDTRSWNSLPANVRVFRLQVPAGDHTVRVVASSPGSATKTQKVNVPAGGFRVVSVRFIR